MLARSSMGLLVVSMVVGCATIHAAPVAVDGSSPTAFPSSWRALLATLNSSQQEKLNTAVFLIGATKLRHSNYAGPPSFRPETLRNDLDGKTYQQILDAASATGTKITRVEHRHGST